MARRSWCDWVVSAPVEREVKLRGGGGASSTALYVDIKCPHCGDVFEATAASVSKNKSNVCSAHLAKKKCALVETQQGGVDATVLALPPSKQRRTSVVVHQECNRRFATLEERVQGLEKDRDAFIGNLIAAGMARAPVTHDNIVPQIQVLVEQQRSVLSAPPHAPDTSVSPAEHDRLRARVTELEVANATLREQLGRPEPKEQAAVRWLEASGSELVDLLMRARGFIDKVCTEHNVLAARHGHDRRFALEDFDLGSRLRAVGRNHNRAGTPTPR